MSKIQLGAAVAASGAGLLLKFRIDAPPRWLRDIVPLICWMALIFALSSRSALIEIDNPVSDRLVFKGAHVIVYAFLAWLWWRALSPRRWVSWPILFAAWFLTTLYGVSDEIHQSFVPGRHARVADVFFDAAGALAMVIVLRRAAWVRFFHNLDESQPSEKNRSTSERR